MKGLDGKVAIVIGAGSGLGEAIAKGAEQVARALPSVGGTASVIGGYAAV